MKIHHKPKTIEYPDSDGQPMAENTLQFEYIATIKGGFDALFRDDPQVFVAGDLLWYPVEGQPETRTAPDVFVAFGRPKGYRGSYCQWMEADVAPQVVFEVLSPGNRAAELLRKFRFYTDHGVEEYYVYDPDRGTLNGWLRSGADLHEIPAMAGWSSPRTCVRFFLEEGRLVLMEPAGRRFATYVELAAEVDDQRRRIEQESGRAEQECRRAEQERRRADRLAARLRELGHSPDELE